MWDVENHDVVIPLKLRAAFVEAVGTEWGYAFGLLTDMALTMPQLIKNDWRYGKGVKLEGNPLDISTFKAAYVNPSGVPWTSIFAKYAGVFYFVDAATRLGLIDGSEDSIDSLLRGTDRWSFCCAGDNILVMGEDGLGERLADAMPYCKVGGTESFLGMVAVKTATGTVHFQTNPVSYIVNFFAPGRSITDAQRGDWAVGWQARQAAYTSFPELARLKELTNSVFRQHFGETLDSLSARYAGRQDQVYTDYIDARVQMDPDRLQWQYTPEEVDPALVQQYFLTIKPGMYNSMYEGLIKTKE